MKRIYFLLLLTFISLQLSCPFCVFSQSGWFQQSPMPTGNNLRSIKFVNSNTGFISGDFGIILKTTNKGLLWEKKNINTNYQIKSIDFFDENTGIAIGFQQSSLPIIFKTVNGGENWYQINLPINRSLIKINCTINNTAYMVGDSGSILKTTNKGNDWTTIVSGFNNPLYSVYFTDNNIGYAIGVNALIIKTTNGGQSWIQQISHQSDLNIYDIFFNNPNTGYICGGFLNGEIQKTTDGGNNWILQSVPYSGALNSVHFINPDYGFSVGNGGAIIKTTDGGNNWNYQYTNLIEKLTGVQVISIDTTYMIGFTGTIEMTNDGGNSWLSQFSGSVFDLQSIYFSSLNTGYSIGIASDTRRHLIKTINGGLNWIYQTIPTNEIWNVVYFLDDSIGFIGGLGGNLFKTINGGVNWIDTIMLSSSINDLYFLDLNTGFITGSGGILKTTNKGVNWELKEILNGTSIKFVNFNTGFTSGYENTNNYVYKTNNSGENWFRIYTGINDPIYSEYFVDENTGFVCGGNFGGFILKTIDGGVNWINVYSDSVLFPSLKSIRFVNANTGICAGSCAYGGYIIKTTNSGQNWNLIDTIRYNGLNSMYFINDSTGYVCGQSGLILKTTTGGEPIGIKRILNSIPAKLILYQNYPNPFNPYTIIKYEIPITRDVTNRNVKLIIYDILGRKVEMLVNENLKPGSYEVTWDALNFASGIYFYRIDVANFVSVKKMVLIK